ncbi:hypothetical protein SDC9_66367 [bioreactor metagenome]|uniref:HTH luxR-type domain-containing protein n=1 Tax=bioreactor metagenome TaxID=1076179 RepID=A0A644XUP8_9ZZZZ
MKQTNIKIITIASFTFFCAWMLSFVYEGQILYVFLAEAEISAELPVFLAIIFHGCGLFLAGFWIDDQMKALKAMLLATLICFVGSLLFILKLRTLWLPALYLMSFSAGVWMACWGDLYGRGIFAKERIKIAAAAIGSSTSLMIVFNVLAINVSPTLALGLAMLSLLPAFWFVRQLTDCAQIALPSEQSSANGLRRAFGMLCLFIVIITINSGLMFQIINPAFSSLLTLTSWYWAVPYVAAIILTARYAYLLNRSHILYGAIGMLGLGFIGFLVFDRSAASYLIVNTLILGSLGIIDLVWWTILGDMLEYHHNPVQLLGLGLGFNLLGILFGEAIANTLLDNSHLINPTTIGLTVVCLSLLILPPMHLALEHFVSEIKQHGTQRGKMDFDKINIPDCVKLTEREKEILQLLLQGYTYYLIAEALVISVSTVKTHVKNIYNKFGIRNKSELIKILDQKSS